MEAKDKLANRIKHLCKSNHISYYTLAYTGPVIGGSDDDTDAYHQLLNEKSRCFYNF